MGVNIMFSKRKLQPSVGAGRQITVLRSAGLAMRGALLAACGGVWSH